MISEKNGKENNLTGYFGKLSDELTEYDMFIDILQAIRLMSTVLANSPGDQGPIPGQVITKAQKIVLDTSLINTQHYKLRIKDKVEQSRK